jgi:hypothetical protein
MGRLSHFVFRPIDQLAVQTTFAMKEQAVNNFQKLVIRALASGDFAASRRFGEGRYDLEQPNAITFWETCTALSLKICNMAI